MRARWGATQAGEPHANRRVGAPKQGCERVRCTPCACKGEGVQAGWCATQVEWQANGRVGTPKRGCEKEPATGDSAPLCACKGRGCASGAAH